MLHWVCCSFLAVCAGAYQFLYAASDRLFLADHDGFILQRTFAGYDSQPFEFVLSSLGWFLSGHALRYAFSDLWTSLHFLLFGRTLFVSKACMFLPLLALLLGTYFLTYIITRRELAGFLAALLVLNLPVVLNDSRTHFPFIPLAAACLLACWTVIDNLDLRDMKRCLALLPCLWLCALIHLSAVVYFLFFFAYLFFSNKDKTRYALLLAAAVLIAAWNRMDIDNWLTFSISHSYHASWGDNLLNLLNYLRFGTLRSVIPMLGLDLGLLMSFSLAAACLLFPHLKRERPGPGSDGAGTKLAFLSSFLLYAAGVLILNRIAPFPFFKPPNTVLIFYPLFCIVLLSLMSLTWERTGAVPVRVAFTALCLYPVCGGIARGLNFFRFQDRPPLEVQGHYQDRKTFDEDLFDIGAILWHLGRENPRAAGAEGLAVFKSSVTLRDDGKRAWLEAPPPFIPIWPMIDDTAILLEPQAFYNGLRIRWERVALWGDAPLEGRHAGSRPRYFFLTVVHKTADMGKSWNMPETRLLLERLREKSDRTYKGFFTRGRLLANCRLHRNIFLYVFRSPPARPRPVR